MRYYLQMLFCFWNKKLKDFSRNFAIGGQRLIRNFNDRSRGSFLCRDGSGLFRARGARFRPRLLWSFYSLLRC